MEELPTPTASQAGVGQLAARSDPPSPAPHPPHCTAFNLPANGLLVLNSSVTITLETNAVYQPFCTDEAVVGSNGTVPISEFQDPFISSTVPQIFVMGVVLVVAATLFIILVIRPRTSLGPGGSGVVLGKARGTPSSVIGMGGRPLLQKVATLTVFVSLLIATVNSFQVASSQYAQGFQDAEALTIQVVGSEELRIIRVISDTFLWLAQVQTLIRLFPRHKEKVIIKWIGFALILLDTVFSILDNFWVQGNTQFVRRPQNFNNGVSALWYLFQLALSVVYMCSVLYYSIVKRRFAYYHHRMRNISVVALLSIASILIPVVFFVVDITEWTVIGWGDYVRWVGAAAASVVVWEWVERIEALEREERKDGILGREIFEGDEMLSSRGWTDSDWPRKRRRGHRGDGRSSSGSGSASGSGFSSDGATFVNAKIPSLAVRDRIAAAAVRAVPRRKRPRQQPAASGPDQRAAANEIPLGSAPIAAPRTVASPVSRSDNTSAASTVYAVINHPIHDVLPAAEPVLSPIASGVIRQISGGSDPTSIDPPQPQPSQNSNRSISIADLPQPPPSADRSLRSRLGRPFRRLDASATPPVPNSGTSSPAPSHPSAPSTPSTAAGSRNRFRMRRAAQEPADELPRYVIRGGGANGEGFVVEEQEQNAADAGNEPTSVPLTPGPLPSPRNFASEESLRSMRLPTIANTLSSRAPAPAPMHPRDTDLAPSPSPAPPDSPPPHSTVPPGPSGSHSMQAQGIPSAAAHTHRAASNSSRQARRNSPAMPPLVEGELEQTEVARGADPAPGDESHSQAPGRT